MRRAALLCTTVGLLSGTFVPAVPASAAMVAPSALDSVACASSTRCVAVGVSFQTPSSHARSLVERWNGSSWSVMPSANGAATSTWLAGVACTSATSCMAVGNTTNSGYGGQAYAEQLVGNTWSTVGIPAGGTKALLSDIACTGAKNCFAVGEYTGNAGQKPLALRWNGQKWSIVSAALPTGLLGGRLRGVGCASAAKCFAVGGTDDFRGGNVAIVERWTGTKWVIERQFTTPGGVAPELVDVSCPTTTRCRAVGNDGSADVRTLAAAWNGSTWSLEASANRKFMPENYLLGVSCWTASDCFAVGEARESHSGPTHTLIERHSGTTWSVVASPNKNPEYATLDGIDCIGPNRCFAVGTSDAASPVVILEWNGTRWTNLKPP